MAFLFGLLWGTNALAGAYNFTSFESTPGFYTGKITGSSDFDNNGSFETVYSYCMESQVTISVPGTYIVQSITPINSVNQATYLFDRYSDMGFTTADGTHHNSLVTNTAIQVAIWDYYGQSYPSLTPGTELYKVVTELEADATLHAGTYALKHQYLVVAVTNSNGDHIQNQIVQAHPVPIPATLWMLGFGLTGLAGMRKRLWNN